MAAANRARRIAIVISGTRGDVQPVIALSLALRAEGCELKIICNVNHLAMLEKFGIDGVGFLPDIEKLLAENDAVRAMMATGEPPKGPFYEEPWDARVARLRTVYEACREFGPDVVLYNVLVGWEALFVELDLGLCALGFSFQPAAPSRYLPPLGFPKLPLGCNMYWWDYLTKLNFKALKSEGARLSRDALGRDVVEGLTLKGLKRRTALTIEERPFFISVSEALFPPMRDWPRPTRRSGVHMTGFWRLTPAHEEDQLRGGSAAFGGDQRDAMQEFLASGTPPVYLGWGSMIVKSPEFMAQLAVRALRRVGKRGIVLSGWARLAEAHLEGAEDSSELLSYAKDNVLWLASAPHAVLFRQCAVTVHHGGAGTTAAALHSGVPTVVTPVWLDQFLYSKLVHDSGAGVSLQQLGKVTAEELAEGIRRCLSPAVVERAKALGAELDRADGAISAASALCRFVDDEVRPGRWRSTRAPNKVPCLRCFRGTPVQEDPQA